MSLMLKLLSMTLLLSSFVYASTASEKIEDFLEDKFSENPKLKSADVQVEEVRALKQLPKWNAYIIDVQAVLKNKPKQLIKQKMIWFSNGEMITKDLTDINTGESLVERVKPKVKPEHYAKNHLIYGSTDARHKVVIFSDPLCPFCKGFVPGAIKNMKKEPQKFAIYYYHFPLARIHPASVTLVKAAVAAEHKGTKDVILKLYNVKINPREKNAQKILDAFNKAEGTHITLKDINTPAVIKQLNHDKLVANDLMVGGTPTVYLDGSVDNTKKKYLKVK
ncbi:DsbA family protein [Sulfurimonas autotrophica]|uniref:DSBA oxidoreductase n=1 Tax=Sulfurimonas autotrophica (strain ATCC BAA-671 / DSM 16294 / JCM 11897 / OK10) TaxID=563040 RepID=E0URL3_SULAO|nr:DsbA family protein [Sulfurimonas autotrophica]ADN08957.1 DSBA oxidoreductase [Sulfurimonas autotrophica DSM 16294]